MNGVSNVNWLRPWLLRRAKPLLGTLVEIACVAPGAAQSAGLAASEAGFAAVARVHRLMSRHEAASDLYRFNAAAPGQWTTVAPETITVFAFALKLSVQTGGIFDVCAACNQDGAGHAGTDHTLSGSWRDVEIDLQCAALRKHAPLQADLGGVAKGYAVDAAVRAMQQAGSQHGWVNAGGDLRVFGDLEIPVRVRAPQDLSGTFACTSLRDRAAATSAEYLQAPSADHSADHSAVHSAHAVLCHGITRQPVAHGKSWTVAAPHCMAADALTKLVAATGDAQHPLLAHYAAQAWIF